MTSLKLLLGLSAIMAVCTTVDASSKSQKHFVTMPLTKVPNYEYYTVDMNVGGRTGSLIVELQEPNLIVFGE